jgi:hypothetical protein
MKPQRRTPRRPCYPVGRGKASCVWAPATAVAPPRASLYGCFPAPSRGCRQRRAVLGAIAVPPATLLD